MDRAPAGRGAPIEWRRPIRVYHNPTFHIYTNLSSFLQVRGLPNATYHILSETTRRRILRFELPPGGVGIGPSVKR